MSPQELDTKSRAIVKWQIGQMHVYLTPADAGIELGSIPASESTVNDPSPLHVRLDVYKLTIDAG